MKRTIQTIFFLSSILTTAFFFNKFYFKNDIITQNKSVITRKVLHPTKKGKKKTPEERAMFDEARLLHEFYMQVNPVTGTIPVEEKRQEWLQARRAPIRSERATFLTVENRGPSNLGGRTRALAFDMTDATSNTILAGSVSGGVFRTTNGGTVWTKVSPNNQQHNVTSIAQDPRVGFRNNWYYSTGESSGNSVSESGAFYTGHGVWKSTDNGLTWVQLPNPTGTNDEFSFDHRFDIITRIAVHPTTGDLIAAALGRIYRWDISASSWITERTAAGAFATGHVTDVVIATTGRIYASFAGVCPAADRGIWTSNDATGAAAGTWTRIATNAAPAGWAQGVGSGRAVMALAPSNQNILYVLYDDGTTGGIEGDIWRWNQGTSTWTNFTAKLPDEAGGSAGNDPFAIQGGYDLVVSVKPDNENFVVIGGTNVYKIANISTDPMFQRIGGYDGPNTYALWNNGGGDTHHPDVHALVFDPNNVNRLFSGTDGGVHRSTNYTGVAASTAWTNMNNNYQTYQYYQIDADQQIGSDIVLGGAQDNGTTAGGLGIGLPDKLQMSSVFSGDGCACAISRQDPCLPFFMSTQNGEIYRDCPAFATITPTGSTSDFVTYFYMDPDNQANLYYAGEGNVWKTNNSQTVTAGTWTNMGLLSTIPPGGFTDFVRTYATTRGVYNAATSYLLIGTDEGKVFRLTDPRSKVNLTTATNITPPTATLGFPSIVSGIAIHPTNRNIVMVVYANYGTNSIYLTTNATAATPTWTLVEQNLAAHSIRSVAIAEVSGQTIYFVGTVRGLYSNDNPTVNQWFLEGGTQIGFGVVSSLVYRPSDNKLFIGTHGNGMFEASVNIFLSSEIASLSGSITDNDQVQLEWITENEFQNDRFEVERSFDAVNFEKIGSLPSQGDNAHQQFYRLKDAHLEKNIQYYRLRTVELNGNAILSNIIAVETDIENKVSFDIYPNPVENEINIRFDTPSAEELFAQIYTLDGRFIKTQNIPQHSMAFHLDIAKEELKPGVYIFRIKGGKGFELNKKFYKK